MKKFIHLELQGGLGNQLFQYYAGFYSSSISDRILVFDERQVKNEIFFKSRVQSGMQINGLKQVKGIENIYLRFSKRNITLFTNKVIQKFKKIIKPESFLNFSPGGDTGAMLDPSVLNFKNNNARVLKLSGYFQSPKIVSEAIKLGALTQIECKNPSKELMFYLNQSKLLSPIGIHIRLLDYYSDIPNIKIKNYILQSVGYFRAQSVDSPLWFFSDDLEYLNRILPEELKSSDIAYFGPKDFSDVETLVLLISCKYLILSRSTFSYWAGFFQKSQLVAYPDPISLKNDFENYDLLSAAPASWKRISF